MCPLLTSFCIRLCHGTSKLPVVRNFREYYCFDEKRQNSKMATVMAHKVMSLSRACSLEPAGELTCDWWLERMASHRAPLERGQDEGSNRRGCDEEKLGSRESRLAAHRSWVGAWGSLSLGGGSSRSAAALIMAATFAIMVNQAASITCYTTQYTVGIYHPIFPHVDQEHTFSLECTVLCLPLLSLRVDNVFNGMFTLSSSIPHF